MIPPQLYTPSVTAHLGMCLRRLLISHFLDVTVQEAIILCVCVRVDVDVYMVGMCVCAHL